ncbi:MAG: flagellar protein FliT [Thiomicrorhabdus sp.]|nr:flagellar protein FliT [Thiomicrorhabdus sp.]
MSALEITKLQLLSHSKNMLDAAQKNDWDRLSALEHGWLMRLQSSVDQYGDELAQVGQELLKDSQQIQACVALKQKALSQELGKNTKNIASIKSYLE